MIPSAMIEATSAVAKIRCRCEKAIVAVATAMICESVLVSENPASRNGTTASYQRTERRSIVVASHAVRPAIGTTYVSSPVCHKIDCGTSIAPSATA